MLLVRDRQVFACRSSWLDACDGIPGSSDRDVAHCPCADRAGILSSDRRTVIDGSRPILIRKFRQIGCGHDSEISVLRCACASAEDREFTLLQNLVKPRLGDALVARQ